MEQNQNSIILSEDTLSFERPSSLTNEEYQCSPNHYLAIILCKRGYKTIQLNFTEYRLEPGSLIFLFPNTLWQPLEESDDYQAIYLSLSNLSSQKNDNSNIFFNLETILSLGSYVMQHPQTQLTPHEAHVIEEYYGLIRERYTDKAPLDVIRSLFSTLFLELNQMFSSKINRKKLKITRKEDILWQFLNLLRVHYSENRTVEFYADKLCISPKHLSSVVKQLTHHTAHELIAKVVIMMAKQLLKTTTLSIQEIADQLNFANQSFFGKFFKQHTGLSPSAYREK